MILQGKFFSKNALYTSGRPLGHLHGEGGKENGPEWLRETQSSFEMLNGFYEGSESKSLMAIAARKHLDLDWDPEQGNSRTLTRYYMMGKVQLTHNLPPNLHIIIK